MKRRIRHINSAKQIALPPATRVLAPTNEEIRQRAHEIFISRGGSPGNELDDWFRAEQELKQERGAVQTDTTQ